MRNAIPSLNAIKLVILDIDGVIFCNNGAVPMAREAIELMRKSGLAVRFLTNDSVSTRMGRAEELTDLGFAISPLDIYTGCSLAANYLEQLEQPRTLLLVDQRCRDEFIGARLDRLNPEVVVVGDVFERFNYDDLNAAFRALKRGARLVATQKNHFSSTGNGPNIDVGFLVAGLEFCADTVAEVVGKPAKSSYLTVCSDLHILPSHSVMVSDDLRSDLRGAHDAGLITAHVTDYHVPSHQNEFNTPDIIAENLWRFAEILHSHIHET